MSLSITELGILFVTWWFFTAIYVLATGLVGVWAGLTLKHVFIGIGPTLFSFGFLGGRVNLRPIPVGGSTLFRGDDVDDHEDWTGCRFIDLSFARRVPVIIVGPLLILFLGGVIVALSHTRMDFLIGVLGIWVGGVNLIPLPALNGGALLFSLFPGTRHRDMDTFLPSWAFPLSLLTILGLHAAFLWVFLVRTDILLKWFKF